MTESLFTGPLSSCTPPGFISPQQAVPSGQVPVNDPDHNHYPDYNHYPDHNHHHAYDDPHNNDPRHHHHGYDEPHNNDDAYNNDDTYNNDDPYHHSNDNTAAVSPPSSVPLDSLCSMSRTEILDCPLSPMHDTDVWGSTNAQICDPESVKFSRALP